MEKKKNIIRKKLGLIFSQSTQFTNKISYKKRNPYIDLIRILGMYAIIVHHILVHGKAIGKYRHYYQLSLMNTFSFWHVSSFALVSGIVGYKTSKYSNLLFLWLCTLFYSVSIHYAYKKYRPYVANEKIFHFYYPVIFFKYWYFTEYFGMYLFLPLINNGIATISKGDLKIVILSLLGIFIFWKDYMTNDDVFRTANGYSVLWLLIFYITGTYFGKYKININRFIFKVIACLVCILVFFGSTLLCFYLPYYKGKYNNSKIVIKLKQLFRHRINSLTMILQTISITLFLSQLKYNKFLGKIITFLGPLTFGVYLIHEHDYVRSNIIRKLFNKDSNALSLRKVIFLVLYRSFLIFIICSIIDYIRHLIFTLFRVRKICIYLEKIIKKIFN